MKHKGTLVALIVVILLIVIQFVPVDRSNPPVKGEIQVPPAVSKVLRVSCYDCHSYETEWPWYSQVAPISWIVTHDVHEGRSKLNFSTWNELNDEKRTKMVHEIWEEVSEGEMPLRGYLFAHPDARLSEDARQTVRAWAESVGGESYSDDDADSE
jgi:hypothetical protein